MTEQALREELTRLGRRRTRHVKEGESIQEATRKVIKEVRRDGSGVSMEDAAEALGLHRSTLYEMYVETEAAA